MAYSKEINAVAIKMMLPPNSKPKGCMPSCLKRIERWYLMTSFDCVRLLSISLLMAVFFSYHFPMTIEAAT